jgi:hypothetical protein
MGWDGPGWAGLMGWNMFVGRGRCIRVGSPSPRERFEIRATNFWTDGSTCSASSAVTAALFPNYPCAFAAKDERVGKGLRGTIDPLRVIYHGPPAMTHVSSPLPSLPRIIFRGKGCMLRAWLLICFILAFTSPVLQILCSANCIESAAYVRRDEFMRVYKNVCDYTAFLRKRRSWHFFSYIVQY